MCNTMKVRHSNNVSCQESSCQNFPICLRDRVMLMMVLMCPKHRYGKEKRNPDQEIRTCHQSSPELSELRPGLTYTETGITWVPVKFWVLNKSAPLLNYMLGWSCGFLGVGAHMYNLQLSIWWSFFPCWSLALFLLTNLYEHLSGLTGNFSCLFKHFLSFSLSSLLARCPPPPFLFLRQGLFVW